MNKRTNGLTDRHTNAQTGRRMCKRRTEHNNDRTKKQIWISLFLAFDGLEFSHKTCSQHIKYYAITMKSEVQTLSAHPIYISSASYYDRTF